MKRLVLLNAPCVLVLVVSVLPGTWSCQALAARTYMLSPADMARSYLDAQMVIVGDVISRMTETVQVKSWVDDEGWEYRHKTLKDTYHIKVDSLLKGNYVDSVIVAESEPYGGGTERWRSEFQKLDEQGGSMYLAQGSLLDGNGGGPGTIHRLGRYIVLLGQQDSTYISVLAHRFDERILDFYREVEAEGEDYLKRFETSR